MTSPQSPKAALAKLLAICSLPMYAVDERRRIVYCNPACAGWLGIEPATLISQRCDYHSAGPPGAAEDLAAGLCPPPEVFHGQRTSGEVSCRDLAGQLQRRRAEFLPLPGQRDSGFAVVASEVRTLSQRSAAAAKEIKELIGDSVEKVDAGTKQVDEAGTTMQEIVSAVQRVTDIMAEITAASQ